MNEIVTFIIVLIFISAFLALVFQYFRSKNKKSKQNSSKTTNRNEKSSSFDFNKVKENIFSDVYFINEVREIIKNEIFRINSQNIFDNHLKKVNVNNYEKYINEMLNIMAKFRFDYTIFDIYFFTILDLHPMPLEERVEYAIDSIFEKKENGNNLTLKIIEIENLADEKTFYILCLSLNSNEEFYLIFADINYELVKRLNSYLKTQIINKNKNENKDFLVDQFVKKEENFYHTDANFYFEYLNSDNENEYDENYFDNFDFDSFNFDDSDWDEFLNRKEKRNQSNSKDYHAILGVSKNATEQEIKIAFRKKAKEWHPDVCNKENAEVMFKEINEAYNNLINKK